jgi:serine/threonine-protein kinase
VRQAEISLQRLGLVRGKDIEGYHSEIPQGVIIRTLPAFNDVVRIGDTVQLVLSSGNRGGRILLPDFRGMSLSRVQSALDSLGLVMGRVDKDTASKDLPNTVTVQYPLPGEYLPERDTVRLAVTP